MIKEYRKRILRHPYMLRLASWLLANYMRFVFKTNQWTFLNRHIFEHYWQTGEPIIACFWHNRLGMMTFSWQSSKPFHMLISGHPDGRIIAKTIERLKFQTIAGSTKKGATVAIRHVLRALKTGEGVGITPDGPRGPRFSVSPSLIQIAKKAKVNILPISYATTHRYVLPTWDKLIIPLPFGKGYFTCGELIQTAALDSEKALLIACENLKSQLVQISDQVDGICGHPRIPHPSQEEKKVKGT